MDGVLAREEHAIPGADRFLSRLRELQLAFLVLTNNSIYTRRDLSARLRANGLDVPEQSIFTSALATARFLEEQRPGGSAFVIGEAGLTTALHQAGYTLTDRSPDYVVLGETRTYGFERITHAIRLVLAGARFIATNPDPIGPSEAGPLPATGSIAALIIRATDVDPYFIGKPNPLMMRSALNALGAHSESTTMIGDRMDTDIVAGLEAGLETILVLSGVTARPTGSPTGPRGSSTRSPTSSKSWHPEPAPPVVGAGRLFLVAVQVERVQHGQVNSCHILDLRQPGQDAVEVEGRGTAKIELEAFGAIVKDVALQPLDPELTPPELTEQRADRRAGRELELETQRLRTESPPDDRLESSQRDERDERDHRRGRRADVEPGRRRHADRR